MRNFKVTNFIHGKINRLEPQSIPEGAASDSLNWLTLGDRIELSRRYNVLGDKNTGVGKITGLHVAIKNDGTELPIRTRGRKVEYLDTSTDTWVENGTNVLPAEADGQDISFDDYSTNAGTQVFLGSPKAGLFKLFPANPGSILDVYNASKNFKGYIKIGQNRMFLWQREDDESGIYGSYIDAQSYTTVSGESVGTGDNTTKTFTGTLAALSGTRTAFGVSITDGVETFTDDYNGVLTGDQGGTGTINYITGAYSVTFNTAPAGAAPITADYQWEDTNANGITDFTKSATRTAGQGFVFRQDDGGGNAQSVVSYKDTEFCFHERKTWQLDITDDDTNATNLIYRENVGIPNWRAAVPTGDGIYYIDDRLQSDPKLRILTYDTGSSEVIPVSISNSIIFTDLRFDAAASIEWGDYILFSCRTSDSSYNNRLVAFHKIYKSIDILEFYISCMAIYAGVLIAGDSLSDNVFKIFSLYTDNGSDPRNFWIGGISQLGLEELKRTRRILVEGEIGVSQEIEVFANIDRNGFQSLGTIVQTGDYVDRTSPRSVIGTATVGSQTIGGEGSSDPVYHYRREFRLGIGKFKECQLKFVANNIGYASVTMYDWWDILSYGHRQPTKYRSTNT